MVIEIGSDVAKALDEAAFEGSTTPTALANELLRDAVKAYRDRVWGRAA